MSNLLSLFYSVILIAINLLIAQSALCNDIKSIPYCSVSQYDYSVQAQDTLPLIPVDIQWAPNSTTLFTRTPSVTLHNGQSMMITMDNPSLCPLLIKGGTLTWSGGVENCVSYWACFQPAQPSNLGRVIYNHCDFENNQNPMHFAFCASQTGTVVISFQVHCRGYSPELVSSCNVTVTVVN